MVAARKVQVSLRHFKCSKSGPRIQPQPSSAIVDSISALSSHGLSLSSPLSITSRRPADNPGHLGSRSCLAPSGHLLQTACSRASYVTPTAPLVLSIAPDIHCPPFVQSTLSPLCSHTASSLPLAVTAPAILVDSASHGYPDAQ